ncbi:MAG: glycoside hydrolase family 3 protein [Armatimonadota bacterium]
MTEQEVRELVAEVVVLRNNPQWRAEDNELIASGAALSSQVGREDVRERANELRALSPGQLILQTDMETGSYFAPDGTAIPPLMALGAADDEELAEAWGYAVGIEGRRLGVDVTWSPVLDVNTNPDNPIINVRAFGEDAEQVGRLGAAMTRGFIRSGLHPCAKHWPGHGDVAVDSHISLPTVDKSREELEEVDWLPYRMAREAGLESVMTAHLLLPAIDPENCATVSHELITGILREGLGYEGCIFTDSLGMEGLRTTIDSAEAAWMALAAGHDQVLVDYKRPPGDSVEAMVAACMDGRVPEERLRDAVARVRDLKRRLRERPELPAEDAIRETIRDTGRRVAEAAVTLAGRLPEGGVKAGPRPLLVIFDDLGRHGVGVAEEGVEGGLEGVHPLAKIAREMLDCDIIVAPEEPTPQDAQRIEARAEFASGIIGATVAHIQSYKGEGVRLPSKQVELARRAADEGLLRGLMLFESPYALGDLPKGVPTIVGYGADEFSFRASLEALLGERECPGTLPVTVG